MRVGFGAGNYLFGSAGGSLADYAVVNRYFFCAVSLGSWRVWAEVVNISGGSSAWQGFSFSLCIYFSVGSVI